MWKKATEKSRYRLFAKITGLLTEMNQTLAYTGLKIEINTEYTPDGLEEILSRYAFFCQEHGMEKYMKFPMYTRSEVRKG